MSRTKLLPICSDTSLHECGLACFLEPNCVYFQASVLNMTDCALFSQEYRCDYDSDATFSNKLAWNNPYLRRFDKKGRSQKQQLYFINRFLSFYIYLGKS